MKRQKVIPSRPGSPNIEGALDALDAGDLRDLIRDILPGLDGKILSRLNHAIIERAARGKTGRQPSGPTDAIVAEALAFSKAAKRIGYADPSEVENYLRQGSDAFLSRNYHAAFRIFQALLLPISEGEIDLGQDEMFEETLGVETCDCAAQYVVSAYMTSPIDQRADAVYGVIADMREVGCFWEPLREMERIAVEPLPDFDLFLRQWRTLVEKACKHEGVHSCDPDADCWLREAVLRMDGTEGLAGIARSTRRSADLEAWWRALMESGDWEAALAANEEAAEIAMDKADSEEQFLDDAALAAQELGRKDLPERLELAWRRAPSMLRLRRWLGSSGSKGILKNRAAAAIDFCPGKARRQKALLHVVLGDFKSTAKLLASAPGLGWSDDEHPGHLLFPILCRMLGGGLEYFEREFRDPAMEAEELESLTTGHENPRLPNPSIDKIITLAAPDKSSVDRERSALIKAMREAVRKRLKGLTEHKRRNHYSHAALLAAACVAVDRSGAAAEWIAAIQSEYHRFPALRRELDRHLSKARTEAS